MSLTPAMPHHGTNSAAETGEIMTIGEGELFGETALTRGQPAPASIVATTGLEVLRIPLGALEPHHVARPRAARVIASLVDMRSDAMLRILLGKA